MASQTWVWLVVGLLAAGLIGSLEANEFKVGGKQGWVSNPSENYGQWSSRLRFQVNDTLFFKYSKGSDSVLVVSKQDYDACNTENPIMKLDGGDSVFKIERSGPHYFISGNKSNCEKGQKLSVIVLAVRKKQLKSPPLPSPYPSPSPAAGPPASSPVSPSPAAKTPATSPTPASSPLVPSLPPSVSPTPAITPLSPNLAPSPAATTPATSPTPISSPFSPSPATTPATSPTPISSPFSPSPATSVSPTPSITPSSPTPAITPATTPSPSPFTSSTPGITPVSPSPGNTAGITPSSSEISPTTPPAPNSSAPAFTPSVVLVLGLWLGSFVAAGAPRKNMYIF